MVNPSLAIGWPICLALGMTIPYFKELNVRWIATISARVARSSYEIYLTHVLCIWFAVVRFGHLARPLQWLIFVVLLMGIPIVLFHVLEDPMIKFGSRLSERLVAHYSNGREGRTE